MAEKIINDRTYSAVKMTGERAFHNTIWLGKLIGPSLGHLDLFAISEANKEGGKEEAAAVGIAMMANALSQCNPKDVTAFMKEMMSAVYVTEPNGAQIQVSTVLNDMDFSEMVQVLFLAVQENFSNFFAGKLAAAGDKGKTTGAGSARQTFGASRQA